MPTSHQICMAIRHHHIESYCYFIISKTIISETQIIVFWVLWVYLFVKKSLLLLLLLLLLSFLLFFSYLLLRLLLHLFLHFLLHSFFYRAIIAIIVMKKFVMKFIMNFIMRSCYDQGSNRETIPRTKGRKDERTIWLGASSLSSRRPRRPPGLYYVALSHPDRFSL